VEKQISIKADKEGSGDVAEAGDGDDLTLQDLPEAEVPAAPEHPGWQKLFSGRGSHPQAVEKTRKQRPRNRQNVTLSERGEGRSETLRRWPKLPDSGE